MMNLIMYHCNKRGRSGTYIQIVMIASIRERVAKEAAVVSQGFVVFFDHVDTLVIISNVVSAPNLTVSDQISLRQFTSA